MHARTMTGSEAALRATLTQLAERWDRLGVEGYVGDDLRTVLDTGQLPGSVLTDAEMDARLDTEAGR